MVGADQTRDRAAARAAADAGADAFEKNDYPQALELFSRAERLYHAPPHLLFIARSLEKLGRLVEAREAYLKLASEKLPASAPNAFKSAQASGETELNGIEGRLSHVTLKVRGDQAETAVPTMDGAELPSAMIGIPMPVDPGSHKFSVSNEHGRSEEVTVTLQEGARQTVELALDESGSSPTPSSAKEERPAAPVVADSSPAERAGSAQRTWGFVTLGAGAVIAGVGTASWFRRSTHAPNPTGSSPATTPQRAARTMSKRRSTKKTTKPKNPSRSRSRASSLAEP